jgi:hypothetical protein
MFRCCRLVCLCDHVSALRLPCHIDSADDAGRRVPWRSASRRPRPGQERGTVRALETSMLEGCGCHAAVYFPCLADYIAFFRSALFRLPSQQNPARWHAVVEVCLGDPQSMSIAFTMIVSCVARTCMALATLRASWPSRASACCRPRAPPALWFQRLRSFGTLFRSPGSAPDGPLVALVLTDGVKELQHASVVAAASSIDEYARSGCKYAMNLRRATFCVPLIALRHRHTSP